jgi:hypothetical protein
MTDDERVLREKREAVATDVAFPAFLTAFGKELLGADALALAGTTHVHTRLLVTALNDDASPKTGLAVRCTLEFGGVVGTAEMVALLGEAGVPNVTAAVSRAVEAPSSPAVAEHLVTVAAELLRERERVISRLTEKAAVLRKAASAAHDCLLMSGDEPSEDGSNGPVATALAVLDAALKAAGEPG